ncbi:MAG TPA: FAD-dependent oxidoreductase, partial [Flavisolibacter sp.]|nr:FAD-dependent oxidoreductase [Flavisolibacter sp.]
MLNSQLITDFGSKLHGKLTQPGDPDYHEKRKLYNGMFDKRPALIASCLDESDVVKAVNFARENGLLLAVRGGGHNAAGLGSCDDGLLIDLSLMKQIRVDPIGEKVTVEGGCTLGELDKATFAFG